MLVRVTIVQCGQAAEAGEEQLLIETTAQLHPVALILWSLEPGAMTAMEAQVILFPRHPLLVTGLAGVKALAGSLAAAAV